MPIDKDKCMLAVQGLRVSDEQKKKYEAMCTAEISYIDLMAEELGHQVAEDYVAEEMVQHWIITGESFDPSALSVPEFLAIEDNATDEPWHKGSYAASTADEKFRQEAAEPWHQSLRKSGVIPDPRILLWFETHPEWKETAGRILDQLDGFDDSFGSDEGVMG